MKTALLFVRDLFACLFVAALVASYCACESVANWIWIKRGRPAPRREHVHKGCTRKYP